ncbi:MAG TPA: AmmeMemoRadiSam system protein A [Oscillospiraceae bacterium]|nr:AmmeMemoRadiSam system protein A [Oscillospiraceae bacterium]HPS35157.1 AmmeMemoRadiSam system protein A [Oscillospiraceae bacterium]
MSVTAAFAVPHPPIIVPEVGRGEEIKIAKTAAAYEEVMRRIAALKPETVVVTSPHSVMYADYFHISPGGFARGDLGRFRAENVRISVDYDAELVAEICAQAEEDGVSAGTFGETSPDLDHGTMVPIYFLNKFYKEYKLVRIGLSGMPPLAHYRLGQCIAKAANELGRRVVIISSGDLSHKLKKDGPYGFAPEGPQFDEQLTKALGDGDFSALLEFSPDFADAAAECGLRSFQIMAGALDGKKVTHELLSYEGPFGVGYGVAAFEVAGEDAGQNIGEQYKVKQREKLDKVKATEDPYVKLARLSVETYVISGKPAKLPDGLPEEMLAREAGVFVSLKMHGQLRGCIGTIAPTTANIAEEILQNGISAAAHDSRFEPVEPDELPELVYSVDVLGAPERIESPEQLDVKKYGVIVQNGGRRGLLLPDLEGVDTVYDQIDIAKRKAGIRPAEKVELSRFEVVRHR